MSPFARVHISAPFCLLILWFGVVNGWQLLGTILLAATIHELGHCLVLYMVGGQINGFRIGVLGAVLETDSQRLSYGRELLAVLAGPGANLLMAWCLRRGDPVWMAGIGANLILAVFNLLPLYPLDGGRAVYLLSAWAAGPEAGLQLIRWTGTITGAALACGIGTLMWQTGGSLWLLPPAVGALAAAWRSLSGRFAG